MYGNGQAPIFILKEGVQRTRGRSAQSNNIAAAKAVADAVRSTLGPKGMDKMLVCLLYTSPSPRDKRQSRMPSSA